jgi:hypothetical protein
MMRRVFGFLGAMLPSLALGQTPGTLSAPTSTLTRPANTTAYAGSSSTPQLIASSTTAGSIVVPAFPVGLGGIAAIPRLTITTNAPSGWGGITLVVTLWAAAPTYSTGDGTSYTIATGAAARIAQYSCALLQAGDGASCNAAPIVGAAPIVKPGTAGVYWDIQVAGAATPISGQTFTLLPEVWN